MVMKTQKGRRERDEGRGGGKREGKGRDSF